MFARDVVKFYSAAMPNMILEPDGPAFSDLMMKISSKETQIIILVTQERKLCVQDAEVI